jgi:hypothetical protein
MFPVIPHFEKTAGAPRSCPRQAGHRNVAMRPQPLRRLCELSVGNAWAGAPVEAASVISNLRLIKQKGRT